VNITLVSFAIAEGSGAGQFFTPGSIVRLMVEMIEPYEGKIFDSACGSGGNVCAVIEVLRISWWRQKNISMDKSAMMMVLRLCKMNLAMICLLMYV
jgi:type I restriction enzyme M protein